MFYSKPSNPVFHINVPEVKNVKCNFVYNYYTEDESTNETSGVSEAFLKKDPDQIDTTIANFTLRVPRSIEVNWDLPTINQSILESNDNYFSNIKIKDNIDKIVSEEKLISSKFISYVFSQIEAVENAYKDITSNSKLGKSHSGVVDDFVKNLITDASNSDDPSSSLKQLSDELKKAVETIQAVGSYPSDTYNLNFYDKQGNLLPDTSGFAAALANQKVYLSTQINAVLIPNIFANTQLPANVQAELNNFYLKASSKGQDVINSSENYVLPISIDSNELIGDSINSAATSARIIGYKIDKYEYTPQGFIKIDSIVIESAQVSRFVDVRVKYSSIYFYSVSTIAAVRTPGYDPITSKVKYITYLISSQAKTNYARCIEEVPPPVPVDVNFVWDYKNSKLQIVWGMPPNSQRDIKQFQVFRRGSVNEPFELIKQKCFDFSAKKYLTGEKIDGNNLQMSQEEISYVDYETTPRMHHVDHDFKVDIDLLSSSKYIYAVCSVDAHGYSSGYSAQFEVTFDFFKNVLVKKLISISGAPKPYPNLKLNIDLFKDVIKVKGQSSKKMKIYFDPLCYNIKYQNNLKQRVVLSNDDGYYLMQFINLENQKSDKLKVEIYDPQSFTKSI